MCVVVCKIDFTWFHACRKYNPIIPMWGNTLSVAILVFVVLELYLARFACGRVSCCHVACVATLMIVNLHTWVAVKMK